MLSEKRPPYATTEQSAVASYSSDDATESREEWTQEEERALVRKLDCIIMPLLMLAFFSLQLDRGNIGNALTDYFFRDVGITQFQFNVGQQLLSVGIVLLEIPSNIVLYRIGPSLWISGQIIAWSLVATFQAFQKGVGAFTATRLLLGLCESGFIPAALFTITRWYKRDETSKRFSWFFVGNMVAQACSGLISYGILHMRGICGLAGWQWLFLIEGLFGILVGITFASLFPRSTSDPVNLLRMNYFSEREKTILLQRVLLDDPTKRQGQKNVTLQELKRTLTNWRLLPHIILTMVGLAPASTLWSYAPTIVTGLGYERLKSNAMVSIGQWLQLVLNLIWGFLADKWGRRGPLVFLGMLLWWTFALCCRLLIYSSDDQKRFGILTVAIAFSCIYHAVNGSWMALNARSAGERSITLAVFIMSANSSGIIGSQLFQSQDAPLYRTGWTAIVALATLALLCTILANVQYWALNRRSRKRGEKDQASLYHL